jgi:hypothetical protein
VTQAIDFDGQGPTRFCGEVVAFDPNDPEVAVAAGETRGLFISRDAARTWGPVGLAGERITCVTFHPRHKPGYLVVGTCPDAELPLFGLGAPAVSAPKGGQGRLYVSRDHGASWDLRLERPALGITNVALREGYWDVIVLATTRGIYTSENLGHTAYQRMEGIERDTPYTALGTDRRYPGELHHVYAAPLSSAQEDPVVWSKAWLHWRPLQGVPPGGPVVAIEVDRSDPDAVLIVRTSGVFRVRRDGAE